MKPVSQNRDFMSIVKMEKLYYQQEGTTMLKIKKKMPKKDDKKPMKKGK